MIGAVKHVNKALETGVDIICAQGGEGGGHTGEIATSILLPKVVDACRGKTSPLTGEPIIIVGAGGIFDGRGLASALSVGCSGVWVGTRFICADEAGAGPLHQKRVLEAGYDETMRTIIYTGRPCRVLKTPYAVDFEENRQDVIKQSQEVGLPAWIFDADPEKMEGANPSSVGTLQLSEKRTLEEKKNGVELSKHEEHLRGVFLSGQCAGAITEVKPAKAIIDEMVAMAADQLRTASTFAASKL